jgi:aspartokinase
MSEGFFIDQKKDSIWINYNKEGLLISLESFKNDKLKSNTNDLASVTVKLPKINTEIYGIYYYILKHLAWEGINIIEIVSTSNEFTVIVKQDDVDKAFKILMQIKRLG